MTDDDDHKWLANLTRRVEALETFRAVHETMDKSDHRGAKSKQWAINTLITAFGALLTAVNIWVSHK